MILSQISQAALGLQRPFIIKGFDNEVVKAYYKYMVDVAVILGADRNRAERELKDSLTFEIQLANVSLIINNFFKMISIMINFITLKKSDK